VREGIKPPPAIAGGVFILHGTVAWTLRRTGTDFTPPFLKVFAKFGKRHALCFPAYLITHSAHKFNGSKAFDGVGFILFHN
jgi:hypothetical protein